MSQCGEPLANRGWRSTHSTEVCPLTSPTQRSLGGMRLVVHAGFGCANDADGHLDACTNTREKYRAQSKCTTMTSVGQRSGDAWQINTTGLGGNLQRWMRSYVHLEIRTNATDELVELAE